MITGTWEHRAGERPRAASPSVRSQVAIHDYVPLGFLDRLLNALAADEPPSEVEESSQSTRRWYINHAGGYFVCSHTGCRKKTNEAISDH